MKKQFLFDSLPFPLSLLVSWFGVVVVLVVQTDSYL